MKKQAVNVNKLPQMDECLLVILHKIKNKV